MPVTSAGDPRKALLTERDAPHGNGISPVVLARASGGTALAHRERGRHVDDGLSGDEQPSGQGLAEAAGSFDGNDTLRTHGCDPPRQAVELAGVRADRELGKDPAVVVERRGRVRP